MFSFIPSTQNNRFGSKTGVRLGQGLISPVSKTQTMKVVHELGLGTKPNWFPRQTSSRFNGGNAGTSTSGD